MFRRVLMTAAVLALALALCLSAATSAMAQTTNGVISGIVSDAQGGVLPGVAVTGRNVDTGATRTIVTEADGRFRLAGLNPGRYELWHVKDAVGMKAIDPSLTPDERRPKTKLVPVGQGEIDYKAIAHIVSGHAFERGFDLARRNCLDVGADAVNGAKIEHFLGFAHAARR